MWLFVLCYSSASETVSRCPTGRNKHMPHCQTLRYTRAPQFSCAQPSARRICFKMTSRKKTCSLQTLSLWWFSPILSGGRFYSRGSSRSSSMVFLLFDLWAGPSMSPAHPSEGPAALLCLPWLCGVLEAVFIGSLVKILWIYFICRPQALWFCFPFFPLLGCLRKIFSSLVLNIFFYITTNSLWNSIQKMKK